MPKSIRKVQPYTAADFKVEVERMIICNWHNNPHGAVAPFVRARMVREWNDLSPDDRNDVLRSMILRFRQKLIIGSAGEIFYISIPARLNILGKIAHLDFFNPRALNNVLRGITSNGLGWNPEINSLVNGTANHAIYFSEEYLASYPRLTLAETIPTRTDDERRELEDMLFGSDIETLPACDETPIACDETLPALDETPIACDETLPACDETFPELGPVTLDGLEPTMDALENKLAEMEERVTKRSKLNHIDAYPEFFEASYNDLWRELFKF